MRAYATIRCGRRRSWRARRWLAGAARQRLGALRALSMEDCTFATGPMILVDGGYSGV